MAPSQQAAEGQSQLVRLAQDDLIQASQQLFIQIDHAKTPERIFIHYAHLPGHCLRLEPEQLVSIGYLPSQLSGFDGCPLAIVSLGTYPEGSVRDWVFWRRHGWGTHWYLGSLAVGRRIHL